ncbi:hypothetical protein THF1C08_660006 [Vibrio jasicida]|uniref:Uncharacterized protein n=1 Tax=Vibrio jasicida TaxID=766224 RepID=A0AAU9QVR9_9VIBR|nr:hypothetical protein THF1C08_660006 [Vibrio jasicida]CAH1603241.1 hypothetical protein THF1A12_680006 [Vibrio jasicida]
MPLFTTNGEFTLLEYIILPIELLLPLSTPEKNRKKYLTIPVLDSVLGVANEALFQPQCLAKIFRMVVFPLPLPPVNIVTRS